MSLAIIEQAQLALSRLMEQRKKSSVIKAIVTAASNQMQLIEQVMQDFLLKRGLDSAVGANLDIIGLIVGQTRDQRTDDDYRVRLRLRIIQNNSEGTAEDILNIMRTLTGTQNVELQENFPATFGVTVIEPTNTVQAAEIKEAIQRGKAGGVNGDYVAHTAGLPAFAFDGDGDPNKAGFGYTDSDLVPYDANITNNYNSYLDYLGSEGPTGPDTIYYYNAWQAAIVAKDEFVNGPYGKLADLY